MSSNHHQTPVMDSELKDLAEAIVLHEEISYRQVLRADLLVGSDSAEQAARIALEHVDNSNPLVKVYARLVYRSKIKSVDRDAGRDMLLAVLPELGRMIARAEMEKRADVLDILLGFKERARALEKKEAPTVVKMPVPSSDVAIPSSPPALDYGKLIFFAHFGLSDSSDRCR